MKPLPIGISDFKEIIDRGSHYVDKTLLIKEILEKKMGVYLFPRPRRFGKTLNLSMLKYFFERSAADNSYLYENLKIWKHEAYRSEQGQYPVIFITFKDIKNNNWPDTFMGIKLLIKNTYSLYEFLLQSARLSAYEKQAFNTVLNGEADNAQYEASLKLLSELLYKHYGKRAVILIDEYDMPISGGFNYGFYDDVTGFMRNFLSGGLKDNSSLYFSCLTGILRIAKESIFSGLNNLYVSSILENKYSEYFGFIESEVESLVNSRGKSHDLAKIKEWYNGYMFGSVQIYNPWSILNYLAKESAYPQPYWINTSSNELIEDLVAKSGTSVKRDFEILIDNGKIEKPIDDDIIFTDIYLSENALWSFLLMSGYLKLTDKKFSESDYPLCTLQVPNLEVMFFYKRLFKNWLSISMDSENTQIMLNALIKGEAQDFGYLLNQLLSKSVSYFDTSESFYHGFVLGLLVELDTSYKVKSNRESGLGRYDIMLEPKDKNSAGVIIEFKQILHDADSDIKKALQQAHFQIEDKGYDSELKEAGITNILKYAIVFKGKRCFVSLR